MSEEHFDKPMEFNPDRFLDDAGRFKPSDIISFFGVGKRRCPGETLARTQVNFKNTDIQPIEQGNIFIYLIFLFPF